MTIDEVRSSDESIGHVQKLTKSEKGDAFYKKVTGFKGGYKKKKQKNGVKEQKCGQKDDQEVDTSSSSSFDSSDGSPPPANRKDGFFNSWRKRSFSFRSSKWKIEPFGDKSVKDPIKWKNKDFSSRDGQTKLKTKVFFASFDQRSEKAAGESACTALVTVIADWLHSNGEDTMPKPFEFDSLITEGSSEWRKLCENVKYSNMFPDKHFDLETVLEAGVKPITISPEKSFTGFFSPEKFHTLKETMSFDQIWDEIANQTDCYGRLKVYIVSWNDHFFVLKVEPEAYYIIDSLGERLYEGCNQAYILKFDDSTSMTAMKTAKEDADLTNSEEMMICRGKECCKEYIKRFLAAIPVMELEEEERKGTTCAFSLHKRLQIDFHYTSSVTSSSILPQVSLD